jgi:Uma2 family endonuclease
LVNVPAEKTGLMTIDEFVRLYETEGPFEVIDGERVSVNPVVAGQGDNSRIIHDTFAAYNREHGTAISYFELADVLTSSSRTPKVTALNEKGIWRRKP